MTSEKQRQTARENVRKAQSAARRKRTIINQSKATRAPRGRGDGAKAVARKRRHA